MTASATQAYSANPIDLLFDALCRGDVARAREAMCADARIWHGFDRVALTVDELLGQWGGLIAGTRTRFVTDVKRQPVEGGYVQQHLFVVEQTDGRRIAWPVCIVVTIRDARIARIDEYMDRTGFFEPEAGVSA
jgi:ketosteroid isomerase-like protein